jgi:hypothetical protein
MRFLTPPSRLSVRPPSSSGGYRGARFTEPIAGACRILVVGTASGLFPDAFPDAVCTGFGSGYEFGPPVLRLVGLRWLRHTR